MSCPLHSQNDVALSALAPTVDANADDCERFIGVMTAYRKEKPQERHGIKRGGNAASSVAGIGVAAILSLGPGSSSLIEDLWKMMDSTGARRREFQVPK